MRKRLFFLVFVLLSVMSNTGFGQSANMAINLLDALTLTVNQPAFLAADSESNKNHNLIQVIANDHISVVSNRGYVVKAISGEVNRSMPGLEGLVYVSSQIGTTNKGNTVGLTLESDVQLPPANGNPVTVITASNCSWNGSFSTNKFNIAYKVGNELAYKDKKAAPSIIPVTYTVIQP